MNKKPCGKSLWVLENNNPSKPMLMHIGCKVPEEVVKVGRHSSVEARPRLTFGFGFWERSLAPKLDEKKAFLVSNNSWIKKYGESLL